MPCALGSVRTENERHAFQIIMMNFMTTRRCQLSTEIKRNERNKIVLREQRAV